MQKNFVVPVFIINLDSDFERRKKIFAQFQTLQLFSPRLVAGVPGRLLPDSACVKLTHSQDWGLRNKGTIGCFLAHVNAWEQVSQVKEPFAVIIEDDTNVSGLFRLFDLTIPDDAEIMFINERMSPPPKNAEHGSSVKSMISVLQHLDEVRTLGGDAYILTPLAAQKLVATCQQDLYFGHVDGRLLRYATSEADLSSLPSGSWIASVIRNHHHPTVTPALGLLRGYAVAPALVKHTPNGQSSRAENDTEKNSPTANSPGVS